MSYSWQGGSTRAWRKLRAAVLLRDGYRCQLKLDGCEGTATHAHHTKGRAVTGDDPAHLVAACASCNLKVGDPQRLADPPAVPVTNWGDGADDVAGVERSRVVTLVTGPPCAGKSTYVRARARPGDLVLDQDVIGQAAMRAGLARVAGMGTGVAWVIRCCPGPARRDELARQLRATNVVLLHPPEPVLMARAKARPQPSRHIQAVRQWLEREAQGSPGVQAVTNW